MAKVYVTSPASTGGSGGGNLQLLNGAAMDATLRAVADTANTASPLKLSTAGVQTTTKLQITTADTNYIDAEDNSGNNRFTVGRDPASQQVNVDFASNPTGSTTAVGAIRTYVDGVNLSEVMTFREDGNIGINTTTPGAKLDVHSASNVIAQFNRTGAGKSWIQYLQAGSGKWNTGYDNTNGNFTVYDAVNATDRVVVTNGGNLGVGISAPTEKLHVYDTAVADIYAKIQTTQSRTAGLITQNSTSNWFSGNAYSATNAYQVFDQTNNRLQLTLFADGNSQFANTNTSLGAKLGVRGSGSTSATTSLLVQNSAATQLVKVLDDGDINVGNAFTSGNLNASLYQSITINSTTKNRAALQLGTNNIFRGGLYTIQAAEAGDNQVNLFSNSNTAIGFQMSGIGDVARFAPNTGNFLVGTSTDVSSSKVTINSTSQGFLPPRMTNAQRLAIATPAVGLMVYCTDAVEGLYVYKSTGWTFVI
jgi:hypothetical protein